MPDLLWLLAVLAAFVAGCHVGGRSHAARPADAPVPTWQPAPVTEADLTCHILISLPGTVVHPLDPDAPEVGPLWPPVPFTEIRPRPSTPTEVRS